jgi:hypothetical protein
MPDRQRAPNTMPRKRPRKGEKPAKGPAKRRQYNIAFYLEYADRIDHVAETLGIDSTQLLRMIVREHLPKYEKRAAAVERGDEPQD